MRLGSHIPYHAFPSPRGPEDPPERPEDDDEPTPEATDYREALRRAARLRREAIKTKPTSKANNL